MKPTNLCFRHFHRDENSFVLNDCQKKLYTKQLYKGSPVKVALCYDCIHVYSIFV